MTSQPANRTAQPASNVLLVALALGLSVLALWPSVALAEECPNAAFRTGPSTHLPDCRAYELVSPSYKATGAVEGYVASPGGSTGVLELFSAIDGAEGFNGIIDPGPYSVRRTDSGWASIDDEPPASEYRTYLYGEAVAYQGSSLDGQTTVFALRKAGEPENAIDFFERLPDRAIVDVGPGLPPNAPPGEPHALGDAADLYEMGISDDASRLLFDMQRYFWPGDETEEAGNLHSLYEYLGAGNTTPLLVGVDSDGRQISDCGTVLGGGSPAGSAGNGLVGRAHNAISRDGNTVFFTAYPDHYLGNGCKAPAPPVAEVFARVDNGLPDAHTVAISEPSEADCSACYTNGALNSAGAPGDARFEGASQDGSKVFFATTQPLLGANTGMNLYEYDFDAPVGERLVQVSATDATVSNEAGGPPPDSEAAAVISEDGSHVYFFSQRVLTKTPDGEGEAAESGALNLYVFARDADHPAGSIAFVARLLAGDVMGDTSPDGRFLVFTSKRDLTPDDTSSGAEQVFEYDAQSAALLRVSIGQGGFNHDGNDTGEVDDAKIAVPHFGSQFKPAAYSSELSVSADGSYVFFESPVALTPQALNERERLQNIYEYHDGRVSLISDGQDTSGRVKLLSTDESGADVFFTSIDQLVGQDSDTNLDVYDARVNGGFPAPESPIPCAGEACQGPLSGAPTLLSPGSEFQQGGNPPLAATSTVAPTTARKTAKTKQGRPARKRARRRHPKRHGKAGRAAVDKRARGKGGRS
jgi:hypothetical protein